VKLSESSIISLKIDATTDSNRELLALHLSGTKKHESWSRALGVVEVTGHTAIKQVAVITTILKDINNLQQDLQKKKKQEPTTSLP